ncbi:MAG: thioredoxin family protein [Ignavibacteriales bacterium]|nr:thioredoxin family protein [Ignavibacteriales bacterium]
MLRKPMLTSFLILFTFGLITAQEVKPQNADNIYNAALKEAKASDKNVFLLFHASWCGWCKRLEKAIQSNELKKIFEDNYVITHLDVEERGEKIALLENPGGSEIKKNFGGEEAGLPFYVFLDESGKKLADSNVSDNNSNLGYPGSNEEIDAFGKLLKLSAKHMSEKQFAAVKEYLQKNAPKPAPAPAPKK